MSRPKVSLRTHQNWEYYTARSKDAQGVEQVTEVVLDKFALPNEAMDVFQAHLAQAIRVWNARRVRDLALLQYYMVEKRNIGR